MNKVEKIKIINDLEMEKFSLERKLETINKKLEEEKNSCLHIGVDLGYYGFYPSTGNKYQCLLCGKGKGEEYFFEPEYIVYAEKYLPQFDVNDESQCCDKFLNIQLLALGLLKDNSDMTRQELVDELNNLIQESIAYKENQGGPKLEKSIKKK